MKLSRRNLLTGSVAALVGPVFCAPEVLKAAVPTVYSFDDIEITIAGVPFPTGVWRDLGVVYALKQFAERDRPIGSQKGTKGTR